MEQVCVCERCSEMGLMFRIPSLPACYSFPKSPIHSKCIQLAAVVGGRPNKRSVVVFVVVN